jgi:hypothetical protein
MKGDFSRLSFDPHRHFSGVLHQQGRVVLDADLNEQVEIERYRTRMLARDLIGPCGGPRDAAGFKIATSRSRAQLVVGAGRYYVDGLVAENDQDCTFENQPNLPTAADMVGRAAAAPGRYLAYLDVWERTVSAIEDPRLRETALGGPDTSVRLKVVWQVRLEPLKVARQLGCGGRPPVEPDAFLEVRTEETGYAGFENRLYRFEVHSAGAEQSAAFTWSRDNASLALAVEAVRGDQVAVSGAGDAASGRPAAGELLELTDDAIEFDRRRGQLLRVVTVDGRSGTITVAEHAAPLADTQTGVDAALHPKVRRWHGMGEIAAHGRDAEWTSIEDGIEVRLSGTDLRPGDYWTYPARTAQPGTDPTGPQPARRTEQACCPLAVVEVSKNGGRWRLIEDRRRLFRPLRAETG